MITILKHGHAQYCMTCSKCECVFTFEDSDIKNNGCQRDWSEWITCPECGHKNTINNRASFKYRGGNDF